MQLSDIVLDDPDVFVEAPPHEAFRTLRREAPVFWHEGSPEVGAGFWVLSKHADVRSVSKNPALFSSAAGGTNINTPAPEFLERIRALMLNMDPPQHRRFRNIVNKAFTPRMVQALVPAVKKMATKIVDGVAEKGECDFVEDVAALLPMEVICEMIGVPESDRKRIYDISNIMIGFDDPELGASDDERMKASAEMFMYASQLGERARNQPGDDLATALVQAEVDGERLNELEFNSFILLLCVAGNETTRTVTTNGMLSLIEHPDQRQLVVDDPSLLPSAVEEILRFNPAVHYFRRTAQQDCEIRGQKIREGDKVTLWYTSANRDEDVFDHADTFDVRRSPNDHLAFGVGEHFCLGANLARMELLAIFEELLARIPNMELAGPVRRLRSNFVNGVKEMRVAF